MEIRVDKKVYEKAAVIKAAYAFTDKVYVHISQNSNEWVVSWDLKDSSQPVSQREFENELIFQMTRLQVLAESRELRTLMLARAMASTVIDTTSIDTREQSQVDDISIMKDWFHQ